MLKDLETLYKTHDRYEILKDFFKLVAISLNNGSCFYHDEQWHKRENEYKDTMNKYDREEQALFVSAFANLVDDMTTDINKGEFKDRLGDLYMQSATQSKEKAQHFTPYSVGKLMADMTIKSDLENLKAKEVITLNDPCVGGGCLPIAYCHALKENGINYQGKALVYCNDNDERCFYMTYIQLSLIGCPAIVELKDTLLNKNLGKTWHTPMLKFQYAKFKDYIS